MTTNCVDQLQLYCEKLLGKNWTEHGTGGKGSPEVEEGTSITTPRPCAALLQWSIHLHSDLLNQFELSSSRDYFTTSYLIQKKNNLYQYSITYTSITTSYLIQKKNNLYPEDKTTLYKVSH